MKVALAQIQTPLGDFKNQAQKVIDLVKKTHKQVDIFVFPEASFISYPPKDLLLQEDFIQAQNKEIKRIHQNLPAHLKLLLPAFKKTSSHIYNGVFLLEKNQPIQFFAKEYLPNSQVFYESRYFTPGKVKNNFFMFKNKRIQLLICEDLWQTSKFSPPDLIISMHASPFTDSKQKERLKKASSLARKYKCPCFYVNRVGVQDEIIFDGASFIVNKQGKITWQGKFFKPDFINYNLEKNYPSLKVSSPPLEEQQEQALILGIKEFCSQGGFTQAHLGLSGGMDSALVLYLAVKALGAQKVKAYFLPTPFTQKISHKITRELCSKLKVPLVIQDISSLYKNFMEFPLYKKKFKNPVTSQNIQARIRAVLLMSIANENSSFLLGTGNKSELATGYSTLYGDLSGGLLPIGDLWKTEVYNLARFINKKTLVFSSELLNRPPSAELDFDQTDEQDLLPYKKLDAILKKLIKNNSPKTSLEKKISNLLYKSEFKRKQSPPILKISDWAFGEGRRMPIIHYFKN